MYITNKNLITIQNLIQSYLSSLSSSQDFRDDVGFLENHSKIENIHKLYHEQIVNYFKKFQTHIKKIGDVDVTFNKAQSQAIFTLDGTFPSIIPKALWNDFFQFSSKEINLHINIAKKQSKQLPQDSKLIEEMESFSLFLNNEAQNLIDFYNMWKNIFHPE